MTEPDDSAAIAKNDQSSGESLPKKSKQPVNVHPTSGERRTFTAILKQLGVAGKEFGDNFIKKVVVANSKGIGYAKETDFIRDNLNTAMKVAVCLWHMKSLKLYKLKYETFEKYVEGEFNFTKVRAYQLINAHLIADEINKALGEGVIANESQARELLRLKHLKLGDEDHAATHQARVKLMEELKKQFKDKPIPATKIAKMVSERMPAYQAARFGTRTFAKHSESIARGLSLYEARFTKICSLPNISEDDKAKLKNETVAALRALADKMDNPNQ